MEVKVNQYEFEDNIMIWADITNINNNEVEGTLEIHEDSKDGPILDIQEIKGIDEETDATYISQIKKSSISVNANEEKEIYVVVKTDRTDVNLYNNTDYNNNRQYRK